MRTPTRPSFPLAAAFLVLGSSAGLAQPLAFWHVGEGGFCDFSDIQSAIDAAHASSADRKIIYVAEGSYEVRNLRIRSGLEILGGRQGCGPLVTFTGRTTIEHFSQEERLTIEGPQGGSREGVVLSRLTLRHGRLGVAGRVDVELRDFEVLDSTDADGGALFVDGAAGASVTLSGELRDNNASDRGGAIFCRGGGRLSLSNARVTDNVASEGGGIYLDDCELSLADDVLIARNEAHQNGGGIHLTGSSLLEATDPGLEISSNEARDGGGLSVADGSETVLSGRVLFNQAEDRGGGTFCTAGGLLSLSNAGVEGNKAARGAGVYLDGCGLASGVNVRIAANEATADGGGIYLANGSLFETTAPGLRLSDNEARDGGGLYAAAASEAILVDVAIRANEATARGAALAVTSGSHLDLRGRPGPHCGLGEIGFCSQVTGHDAPAGAGLYVAGGTTRVELEGVLVRHSPGQSAAGAEGTALYMNRGQVAIAGSLFIAHEGASMIHVEGRSVDRLDLSFLTSTENSVETILRSRATDGIGPQVSLSYSLIDERIHTPSTVEALDGATIGAHCLLAHAEVAGTSNAVIAPGDSVFVDEASRNYHLHPSSPAIDFCPRPSELTLREDFEGEGRGADALFAEDRTPGSWFDVGVDEFQGLPPSIFLDGFESGGVDAWSAATQ